MYGKKLLIATMLGCAVMAGGTFSSNAMTISEATANTSLLGSEVTIDGTIIGHFKGDLYIFQDTTGKTMNIMLHSLTMKGRFMTADGILRQNSDGYYLDMRGFIYNAYANPYLRDHPQQNTMNEINWKKCTIDEINNNDYAGKKVVVRGNLPKKYDKDGFVKMKDEDGHSIWLKMNGKKPDSNKNVDVYGTIISYKDKSAISVEKF